MQNKANSDTRLIYTKIRARYDFMSTVKKSVASFSSWSKGVIFYKKFRLVFFFFVSHSQQCLVKVYASRQLKPTNHLARKCDKRIISSVGYLTVTLFVVLH